MQYAFFNRIDKHGKLIELAGILQQKKFIVECFIIDYQIIMSINYYSDIDRANLAFRQYPRQQLYFGQWKAFNIQTIPAKFAVPSQEKHLEQALCQDFYNQQLWAVYADWLETQGSSHGELLSLYQRLDSIAEPSRILARIIKLYKALLFYLFEVFIDSFLLEQAEENLKFIEFKQEYGFITEVTITAKDAFLLDHIALLLTEFFNAQQSLFLQKLDIAIAVLSEQSKINTLGELLQFLYQAKIQARLIHFSWNNLQLVGYDEDLFLLNKVFPNLISITLLIGQMGDLSIEHDTLKYLHIRSYLNDQAFDNLVHSKLPNLYLLDITDMFGTGGDQVAESLSGLVSIIAGQVFPELKILIIRYITLDNLVAQLQKQPFVSSLEKLEIITYSCSEQAVNQLSKLKHCFLNLKTLNLRTLPTIAPAVIQDLVKSFQNTKVTVDDTLI